MIPMEIGGMQLRLDPAAISAIRYRAEYGDSVVNDLARAQSPDEVEGTLLRMCWMMIPPADRRSLPTFAKKARRDPAFLRKAALAREALLAEDPRGEHSGSGEDVPERFDEYQVLALLSCCGVDMGLIYEMPILHLLSLAQRIARLRDPEGRSYRPMGTEEMARLYPRRSKA